MIPEAAVEAAAKSLADIADPLGIWEKQAESYRNWYKRQAEAALEAAAPHMRRTITTTAELDALGRSAVIMQPGGTVLVHDGQAEDPWASYVEDPYGGPIWTDSSHITLPVTVLHEGDTK